MAAASSSLVPRRVSPLLDSYTADEPVIALHGPRSVGKSTVLRAFADSRGVPVVDLDDPVVRDAVLANVSTAIDANTPCVSMSTSTRRRFSMPSRPRLNREGSLPGTAVLTGSTRRDALPRTAQALTGLHVMTIWPLSQGELGGVRELRKLLGRLAARTAQILNLAEASDGLGVDRKTTEQSTRLLEDLFLIVRLTAWGKTLRARAAARPKWSSAEIRCAPSVRLRPRRKARGVCIAALFRRRATPRGGMQASANATVFPQRTTKLHVVDSGLAARLMRVSPSKLAALDAIALTEFGNLL